MRMLRWLELVAVASVCIYAIYTTREAQQAIRADREERRFVYRDLAGNAERMHAVHLSMQSDIFHSFNRADDRMASLEEKLEAIAQKK